MTYEEQVKLHDHWVLNYEAERRLKIRDLARDAAESDDAYHGGYRFPVMSSRRCCIGSWLSNNDALPTPEFNTDRTITVSLAPFLQGTAAAQLIAERIIEDQWFDDHS